MPKYSNIPDDRYRLAEKRLTNILRTHSIACARTLEQKISDAGPFGQRIDPHVLSTVRADMVKSGVIVPERHEGAPWYKLSSTDPAIIAARLAEQLPIHNALKHRNLTSRIGQTLEIAVFRALKSQSRLDYLGSFLDIDNHDDSRLYVKEEPPRSLSGNSIGPKSLDFLVQLKENPIWAGVEIKNVREWLYPNRDEIRDVLGKCVLLGCVPVLVIRRFPYVTFKVLSVCGVIFHQTYNQLLPSSATDVANQAKNKRLLGYHDIRVGNSPDKRLMTFVSEHLPNVLPAALDRFRTYKDLLWSFANRDYEWPEFAARVRRRSHGQNEDNDWPDEPHYH